MTPLERAARALAKRNYPGASEPDIDSMWDGYVDDARAVLQAIHEPNEAAMERAARLVMWCGQGLTEDEKKSFGRVVWQTMLDAIRRETDRNGRRTR